MVHHQALVLQNIVSCMPRPTVVMLPHPSLSQQQVRQLPGSYKNKCSIYAINYILKIYSYTVGAS